MAAQPLPAPDPGARVVTGRLHDDDVQAIARAVVELLQQPASPQTWLTAAQVADRLGVDRSTVYGMAPRLGAKRLGAGPKARLRFDAARVDEAVCAR